MPSPESISLKMRQAKNRNQRHFAGLARRALVTITFALAIIVAATVSEANEGGGEKAAEAAGAAKSGGSPSMHFKPACKYSDHEARLQSYTAKIRGIEKEIADMIHSKHHTENSEKVKMLTQQISFRHSDLAKAVRDYEEERLHVRFQHPDRDMDANRQYSAHPLKSLEEIEAAFGLDGRLDRIRKQVGVVFPIAQPEKPISTRQPASMKQSDEDDDMPGTIHLVK